MRNANSQLANSMLPVCALHQPPSPHVSHAETEGETSTSPPSLLLSFGAAPASLTLHRGSPRRSVSEGGCGDRGSG